MSTARVRSRQRRLYLWQPQNSPSDLTPEFLAYAAPPRELELMDQLAKLPVV
ncbi:MAG: hypothetical protein AAGB51_06975 [Planctomycetota bacterium]